MKYDITLVTQKEYLNPEKTDWYLDQILLEDELLISEFKKNNLKIHRINWDNLEFNWKQTKYILIRSVWDYFERLEEFENWLDDVNSKSTLINPYSIIKWNLDKHYLRDLYKKGINIPNTIFIEPGSKTSLLEQFASINCDEIVIKPAKSASAFHTYHIKKENAGDYEKLFQELIETKSMLIQPFLKSIPFDGEISIMVFGGKYSHAVLKKAKKGDFRVQDDFGGTVKAHKPSTTEIKFAEDVVKAIEVHLPYARVDVVKDYGGKLCVSELELIEPELWFRENENSSKLFVNQLLKELPAFN